MTTPPFHFRGPNAFYFARKRHKLDSLRSRNAEHRTCHPGGGGGWSGLTGDGEAWRCKDRTWMWVRPIRAGQWAGPWVRRLVDAG